MKRESNESKRLRDKVIGKRKTACPQYSKMGKKKAARIMKANKMDSLWPSPNYYPKTEH